MFGNALQFNIGIGYRFSALIYVTNSTLKAKLPDSIDLKDLGFVTPVKDQNFNCFGSWAFATTGALEGHIFRKTKKLISLSEQYLIDCGANGNDGCVAGDTAQAFIFSKNNGYKTEEEYPYTGEANDCPFNLSMVKSPENSYVSIKKGDEQAMKEVVANIGPIAVSIIAQNSFVLYRGTEIYSELHCKNGTFVHYLLIVGYGRDDTEDYWLVKNSMGTDWGADGYIKFARNMNMCGIADFAYYPIV